MGSKGHFCYGCNEYFHDSRFGITTHKGCKGKKSLGICVDSKEWGEYHPYNLEEKSKWELIQIIQNSQNKLMIEPNVLQLGLVQTLTDKSI